MLLCICLSCTAACLSLVCAMQAARSTVLLALISTAFGFLAPCPRLSDTRCLRQASPLSMVSFFRPTVSLSYSTRRALELNQRYVFCVDDIIATLQVIRRQSVVRRQFGDSSTEQLQVVSSLTLHRWIGSMTQRDVTTRRNCQGTERRALQRQSINISCTSTRQKYVWDY